MRLKIACTLTLGIILAGCSSTGPIKKGEYKLFPETVSVSPFGNNYTIAAGIDLAGKRNTVVTFYGDCSKRYGSVYIGRALSDDRLENLRLGGSDPADRLFAQLCQAGVPIADRMEDRLSPQQKATRSQQTESTIRQIYGR